jgi:phosphohistidine phosphatase
MGLLILLRHAKAVRDHEAESDRARDLTARGRRDAAAAGAALVEAGLAPLVMRVSPAERTRSTAHIVRPLLTTPPSVELIEPLYMAGVRDIWDECEDAIDRGVIVVGHNPGMHALVALLVNRSGERSSLARRLIEGLPTSTWAAFDVEGGPIESVAPRLLAGWSPKGED